MFSYNNATNLGILYEKIIKVDFESNFENPYYVKRIRNINCVLVRM